MLVAVSRLDIVYSERIWLCFMFFLCVKYFSVYWCMSAFVMLGLVRGWLIGWEECLQKNLIFISVWI